LEKTWGVYSIPAATIALEQVLTYEKDFFLVAD
jgi:hypothetical protein